MERGGQRCKIQTHQRRERADANLNNYLTLGSLTLAYEVPLEVVRKYGLKRLHLELLANDLFYLSSVKRERGLSYPYERSVEFSVRLGF